MDEYGSTPLHLAVLEGSLKVVQCLVESGANLKAADKYGHTSLHLAAGKGYRKVEEFQWGMGKTHFRI